MLVSYLEKFKQRIDEEHAPPKVLGIDVKPTLFQVFQGYVVTGVLTIVGQYLSTQFGSGGGG